MTLVPTLTLRKEELRRRVEALPVEVQAWKDRTVNDLDSNLHFSQLQAIGVLAQTFTEQQQALLAQLDPAGDAVIFQNLALELVKSIIRSQRTWDYFRDKLELRFSPNFKEPLWVADTVAWDCYRPVLEGAAGLGILPQAELREPPLTYLTAEFSPATWVRGSRPNDGRDYHLGTANLPIPVIEMPWDHIENAWEFLSLHHEVGHDLEADLKLRARLILNLQGALLAKNVPLERVQTWLAWQGEVFADLVALQLGGPAFIEALMHLLMLPKTMVVAYNSEDPHPTHYVRILMNAAYIPTLIPADAALAAYGAQIAERWKALYGLQAQFDPYTGDFPAVFQALMDTPMPELLNQTVRQLLPYSAADEARIQKGAGYLRTGKSKPASLRPRHCISAARLAVSQASQEGSLSDDLLDQVQQRLMALVRENGPDGLRGGDGSTPHKHFIASFVDRL